MNAEGLNEGFIGVKNFTSPSTAPQIMSKAENTTAKLILKDENSDDDRVTQRVLNNEPLAKNPIQSPRGSREGLEKDAKNQSSLPVSPRITRKPRRYISFGEIDSANNQRDYDSAPPLGFTHPGDVYRIQTKAYERRNDYPDYFSDSRGWANIYIERLKEFYQSPNLPHILDEVPLYSDGLSKPFTRQRKQNSFGNFHKVNKPNPLPELQDINRQKDDVPVSSTKTTTKAEYEALLKPPAVKITLTSPSGKTFTADEDIIFRHTPNKKNSNFLQPINPPFQDIFSTKIRNIMPTKDSVDFQKHSKRRVDTTSHIFDTNMTDSEKSTTSSNDHHPTPNSGATSSMSCNDKTFTISSPSSISNDDTQSILDAVRHLQFKNTPNTQISHRKSKNRKHLKKIQRRDQPEDDPKKVAMKLSLACRGSCCYCVYSSELGPVKVYVTKPDKKKRQPSA